ncbi:response regulator [Heliobacterium gestii]|uniref:Stage 0 sporulation protein A homolog n=1 Tax=Heliomicrobium gestii TaxID=2699 RepID=A0A845L974_HELGE|nr:response regulator transcription factor [Heliomicrobium gestii]MBM7866527.1 CheY-like chemotaxis protein [Heliomicrobium gestii]MZP43192.1 response regulator [Heliomicrobium gestii]
MVAVARILIGEDNVANCELLKKILSPQGHRVFIAHNGRDVVEMAKRLQPPPEVLLLDIMMPVMDGFQAIAELQRDWRTQSIPIMMITSSANTVDVLRSKSAGVAGYVLKPFEPQALLERIDQIVGKELPEKAQPISKTFSASDLLDTEE